MNEVKNLRQKLERLKGKKESFVSSLQNAKIRARKFRREIEATEKAQAALQMIAQETQKQIEFRISELGSFAMAAIFPDPYEIEFDFQVKRGKAVADMFFTRDEHRRDPKSTGGGAADLGSLALRFSSHALHRPRLRPLMIMDEPLKWLKGSELPRMGAALISEFSQRMNIQIIMITHDPDLIDSADRIFEVEIDEGISNVKTE
jgi:DNA repair exonuclease SbcCD ATPase subunit